MPFADRFLIQSSFFPDQAAAVAWGSEQLQIDFVGGPYLISGLSQQQADLLRSRFQGSISPVEPAGSTPGVRIKVLQAAETLFKKAPGFPYEIDFDLDHGQEYLRIAGYQVMALLTFSPRLSVTLWSCRNDADFPGNIFENIFRIAVTYRLHETGGMLIHSAGIVDNGSALLFPGRSNDGKSTLSKLSLRCGCTVLSDDMNALTWINGQPVLEKVPFSGELGQTWTKSRQYPLKGIFAIQYPLYGTYLLCTNPGVKHSPISPHSFTIDI